MKVQILGTGCAKCRQLYANADQAIKAAGLDAELEKVEKIQEILAFGVMATPALAVDGKVKSAGRLLSADEIKRILGAA
ncbi:MAG: thioredoxin family protein [Armatimonadetes bacterium]|nr:thioredoxin family protein [Armatimonadota bacterium]